VLLGAGVSAGFRVSVGSGSNIILVGDEFDAYGGWEAVGLSGGSSDVASGVEVDVGKDNSLMITCSGNPRSCLISSITAGSTGWKTRKAQVV